MKRALSNREKLMAAGLFFSKFNRDGLAILGFRSYAEAFNTLAMSLKARPASIKNYRDEFDPYFPNSRRGWHKRSIRQYCKDLMDELSDLEVNEFAILLKSQISASGDLVLIEEQVSPDECSSFAKRLMTGQAAEQYFEYHYLTEPCFRSCEIVNTTAAGCGFDYKMEMSDSPFLAVEVKGMSAASGAIQLTAKEFRAAQLLGGRFFLFVVRNFIERPFHTIFRDPLGHDSGLTFKRHEIKVTQECWASAIGRETARGQQGSTVMRKTKAR